MTRIREWHTPKPRILSRQTVLAAPPRADLELGKAVGGVLLAAVLGATYALLFAILMGCTTPPDMGEPDGESSYGFPVTLDDIPISIEELDVMILEEVDLYEAAGIPAGLAVRYVDAWRIMPEAFGDPRRVGEVYSNSDGIIFVRTAYPLSLVGKFDDWQIRDAARQVVGHEVGHVVLGVLYDRWGEGDLWRASEEYGTTY